MVKLSLGGDPCRRSVCGGGGMGCLCSSIDLLCCGGAGGHGLCLWVWGVFCLVFVVVVVVVLVWLEHAAVDYWDSFKLGQDLAGKDSKGLRIYWVQKVFVSLGPKGFRIFGFLWVPRSFPKASNHNPFPSVVVVLEYLSSACISLF
jgi:hypothetical protein